MARCESESDFSGDEIGCFHSDIAEDESEDDGNLYYDGALSAHSTVASVGCVRSVLLCVLNKALFTHTTHWSTLISHQLLKKHVQTITHQISVPSELN